jgi:hypothetical protein
MKTSIFTAVDNVLFKMLPVSILETNRGVPRGFDRVLNLVKLQQAGEVRVTANPLRGTVYNGVIHWRAAAQAHYHVVPVQGIYVAFTNSAIRLTITHAAAHKFVVFAPLLS